MKLFFILLVTVVFTGCASFMGEKSKEYVRVNGTQFLFEDKPLYFMGTNLWYGCYLGAEGATGDRERLVKELDLLISNGITNLRVLAASEKSDIKNSLKPSIQTAPGVYDENLLKGLDFLLAEMKKRKMHAVIFLNNYWEWSGGMSQYNAWFGGEKVIDPEVDGWPAFMKASAAFYTNRAANEQFRSFIKELLARKNTFNGLSYFEDPTIMAWELANEPRPGSPEDMQPYYNWIDSTAAYIKSIDPNHLVTTGNEGTWGSLNEPQFFIDAHKTRNIDYLTCHLWPKNWGWFDAKRIDETYPVTEVNALNYLNEHFHLARQLNKPITLEEFGIPRDSEYYFAGSPVTARDKYYNKIFQVVFDSASGGAPIGGVNFWTWGGYGRAKNPDAKWREGDPFTGDPPQEPQGLNSIFNTDSTTLKIIQHYSEKLNGLKNKQPEEYFILKE